MLPGLSRPASINLRELLERALANPQEPDLSKLNWHFSKMANDILGMDTARRRGAAILVLAS